MSLLIKNARIIDVLGERTGSIGIKDDTIVETGSVINGHYETVIDAGGKAAMPAFADLHTHLRDPGLTHKECMESGMRAAIKGGYSHLTAMANTDPVISTPELVYANLEKAEKLGLCTLTQCAACGADLLDSTPTDRKALSKATKMLSNDGKTIFSSEFMRQLLIDSQEYGFIISTHCQPEEEIIKRDLLLLKEVGGNLHIGHISTKDTMQLIKQAKDEGLKFTCEVTPHHLFGHDLDYKVNPPIASYEDTLALIEGIKQGYIDCLATDHAPHTEEDKKNGSPGISNIEHAFQMYLSVFDRHGIPLTVLSKMLSFNPRKRLGIKGGIISEGEPADIVLADTRTVYIIKESEMISRSHNTPFDGRAVKGKIETTIIKGRIRYDNGHFIN